MSTNEGIIFSAITEAELLAGKANSDNDKRERLLHFLHRWDKKVVDNAVSALAGDISRTYGLSIPDAIIAATCILNNAELLTKNLKDFKKLKELKMRSPY